MKLILLPLLSLSFSATASPLISIKERLRLSLWVEGLEESRVVQTKKEKPRSRPLPEEIERALQKI